MNVLRIRVILPLLLCSAAAAAPQETLRHKGFRDFQGGEAESIAVLGVGALELGPRFDPCKGFKPEAFVWALAADSKGRVYAASGNGGKVYVIDGDKVGVALATDDLEVLCLAVDGKDNVYAGCAPSGKVYRIAPGGKTELFCETGQTYVWALAVGPGGSVYAGTGPDGKLLRIRPDGKKVETVYDSDDKHILSLAVAGGSLYAGTDENGLVYRVTADGKVSVAFDAPARELRCMAADPAGNIYVASADGIRPTATAVPRRGGKPAAAPARRNGGSATPTAEASKNSHTSKRPPARAPRKRPGAGTVSATNYVYRIAPDGKATTLFRMAEIAFLSLAWHDGALYAGTAGEGKVLRIASERDVAVLAQVDPPQVLAVCAARGGKLLIGTGNDGRVYRADAARAETGTYTSEVIDARFRSSWGAFGVDARRPAGTTVAFSTRSGNSEKPDRTWSAWTGPRALDGTLPITSPADRFIQYRLTLSTRDGAATPHVREVSFPYLPDNHAPSIDSIDVSSVVTPGGNGKGKTPPPARPPQGHSDGCISGSVTVSWRASDPNGDELEYDLLFRGRGEKNWKELAAGLTATRQAWDTEAVPDGVYELKVRASDAPQNPRPRAATDELTSEPVCVDNSPPAVTVARTTVRDGVCTVEAAAKDAGSNLTEARYSVDAGPWQPLLPADGIFDEKTEALNLVTDELAPGEHTLVVQAEDSAGNIGSAKTVVHVPE